MTALEPLVRRRRRAPSVPRPGSARAAIAHRTFRLVWLGSFASQIGTWMRTVVLGAYAYELTGSSTYVGVLTFAQLGPMLVLSIAGGVLADLVDRRRWLIGMNLEQLVFAALLALLVTTDPSRGALFWCALAIGVGNALAQPAWAASLPPLVGREDLPGAVALNSAMINGSRVIGPAIAGVLYPILGSAWIFAVNAGSFLFVIGALAAVRFPAVARPPAVGLRERVAGGLHVARTNPIVGRILVTVALFSFCCLPFIGLFPAIAERQLGLDPDTLTYGLLYAVFGLGSCLGALSVGTVLSERLKAGLVRPGLMAFGISLGAFAVVRHPVAAFPVVFAVGAVYFATTTSLMTVLTASIDDAVRGRVLALWFMAFGGTVPLGALAFGTVLDATSPTVVLAFGAVVALVLAWWCNLRWVGKLAMIDLV